MEPPRNLSEMIIDSIVAEVRAHREAIFEECGYDLDQFDNRTRQNSAQLKNDFFNSKRPNETEYPLVVKLGNYMTKNNLDFRTLAEKLKHKWAEKR